FLLGNRSSSGTHWNYRKAKLNHDPDIRSFTDSGRSQTEGLIAIFQLFGKLSASGTFNGEGGEHEHSKICAAPLDAGHCIDGIHERSLRRGSIEVIMPRRGDYKICQVIAASSVGTMIEW